MHLLLCLLGFFVIFTQGSFASYLQNGNEELNGYVPSNGYGDYQGQGEQQQYPLLVGSPAMLSAPTMSGASPIQDNAGLYGGEFGGYGDMENFQGNNRPRSHIRNIVSSYSKEDGHISDTTLNLPLKARARKLAAARKAARMAARKAARKSARKTARKAVRRTSHRRFAKHRKNIKH